MRDGWDADEEKGSRKTCPPVAAPPPAVELLELALVSRRSLSLVILTFSLSFPFPPTRSIPLLSILECRFGFPPVLPPLELPSPPSGLSIPPFLATWSSSEPRAPHSAELEDEGLGLQEADRDVGEEVLTMSVRILCGTRPEGAEWVTLEVKEEVKLVVGALLGEPWEDDGLVFDGKGTAGSSRESVE
jgi:hypothetical protein